jgi:hypothetical protein
VIATLPSGVQAWFDPDSFRRFGRNEWPYYDGVPDRDPMRILPEDVQVTVSMNSFVNTGADDQLQRAAIGNGRHRRRLSRCEVVSEADRPDSPPFDTLVAATLCPRDQFLLLVENRSGGERSVHGRLGEGSVVAAQFRPGRDRTGDVHAAAVGDFGAESVQGRGQFGGVDRCRRRHRRRQFSDQLGWPPAGLVVTQRGEGGIGQHLGPTAIDSAEPPALVDGLPHNEAWIVAQRLSPVPPLAAQVGWCGTVRLGRSTIHHRLALQPPPLLFSRIPPQAPMEAL